MQGSVEMPENSAVSNFSVQKKKVFFVGTALLMLVSVAGLYVYQNYAVINNTVYYQFDVNGFQRLYTLAGTSDRAVYVPVIIDTKALQSLPVIDSVKASDGKRYLIAQETSTQANVYAHDGQEYVRITNSPTMKRSLSIDLSSQTVGFEANELREDSQDQINQVPPTWSFTVADIAEGTERIVTQGTQKSKILEGGREALVATNNTLNLISLTDGEQVELMQIYSPHTLAFATDGSKIAALNPTSKTINTYSYSPQTGLSFLAASDVQERIPISLSFRYNDVIAVYSEPLNIERMQAQEQPLVTIKTISTNEESYIPELSVGASLIGLLYE